MKEVYVTAWPFSKRQVLRWPVARAMNFIPRKGKYMKKTMTLLAFAAATASAFAANTFYWKLDGATWGDPNVAANWDVGSAGGGNPSSLVPGTSDTIYVGSYLFDLNGGSFTGGTIKYVGWDALYTVQVTNGTFSMATEYHPRSNHMDVWKDGKVVFPVGSKWYGGDGMGSDRFGVDVVHAGGRMEFLGYVNPWHANLTVEDGGYVFMSPTTITLGSSYFPCVLTNNGTLDTPNGLLWSIGGGYNNGKFGGIFRFVQAGGTWKAGGPIRWFVSDGTASSYGACAVQLAGGTVEATGRVAFPHVTNCTVAANARLTVDVADNALFDLSPFAIGAGAQITKTGAGTILVGDAVPAALAVETGFIGFTNAVTAATLAANPLFTNFCFACTGNRLDALADYTTYDFRVDEASFAEDDVVFSSADAALLQYVCDRIVAHASGAVGFEIEGEGVKVIPNRYTYTVTVAEGETNELDTATTVLTYGTTTVTNAPFAGLTLQGDAVFRKRGGGTLKSSDALANFTGEIRIEEGVFSVDGCCQLGTETMNAGAPAVRVYDGATLALETTAESCAVNAIYWRNAFRFAGRGKNGLGALFFNCANSQRNFMAAGSTFALDADTRFGFACNRSFDVVGNGFNMNGHRLELHNLKADSSGWSTLTFGSFLVSNSGHILVNQETFSMQHSNSSNWSGSSENTLTLTNSATLSFYGTGGSCPWTLVCHTGSTISPGGGTNSFSDLGNTNVNHWIGPVRLEDTLTVTMSAARKGFAFHGVVSGPGGFDVWGASLQLVNPGNTFAGGVTVRNNGAGAGTLGVYNAGALPCAATMNGTWLHLMNPNAAYALPAVTLATAGESNAVLNVNHALGCEVGTLTGFGTVTNGGVTVTEKLCMTRAGLVAGAMLAVDGPFVYAAGAKPAVDDLQNLASADYRVLHAAGGVTFAGATTLDSVLSRAKSWRLLPRGGDGIVLCRVGGIQIMLR